jgi:hypothetical protein
MKKLSSYQKIKVENERLKHDIYTLIRKSDTIEGKEVSLRYESMYAMNDCIWVGAVDDNKTFDGLARLTKQIN